MKNRLDQLRGILEKEGLDSILISTPENRRYLSGFTGSAGYLIISLKDAILATDFRYVEQAENQSPAFRIHRIMGGQSWLPEIMKQLSGHTLGFESQNLTVSQYELILSSLKEHIPSGITMKPLSGVVEELRAVKDKEEMALLQKAKDISDNALDIVSPTIQEGQTEKDIAWSIERTVRELGAEAISFDTIVAAGSNAALPHHRPSDTKIRNGQPIIIDMGARYQGYCSDLSRTICIGNPDETFRKIYDIVLAAQLTAIAMVRPGMSGKDADNLARVVIEENGYGDNFGHSLGHGVGLEVHENPGVGPGSSGTLLEDMAFTIEPGIYISGWGGVRIEDIVVFEGGKPKVISKATKNQHLGA